MYMYIYEEWAIPTKKVKKQTLCTLQIGFLRFPHTTETRQLGYFLIIQYLQHEKDIFGFLMYQKSLILGYFPIIKIAAVQMALIRPIRRRNDTVNWTTYKTLQAQYRCNRNETVDN